MTTFRPFRNADPPAVVRLWNEAGLGRGAVGGLTIDLFDHLTLAQQHFDPRGLTLAVSDDGRPVGFSLAGFGPAEAGSTCGRTDGVVAAVVVHPDARGAGVGRGLLAAAVEYLRGGGATAIRAGGAPPTDPFLVGLYGGSEPAGFLDSDPAADPFLTACGFVPERRVRVLHRETGGQDRAGFQVLAVRRKTELRVAPRAPSRTWWWSTRYGRLDTLRFALFPRGLPPSAGAAEVAGATLVGLDLFGPTWGRRAVGLRELTTGPGGGPAHQHVLLSEIARRLREEAVDLIEVHADADDAETLELFERAGFEPVDEGTVYKLG